MMHVKTAVHMLKFLAREGLLTSKMTTFRLSRHPESLDVADVKEAFQVLENRVGDTVRCRYTTSKAAMEVWCHERVFDKIFHAVFILEKVFPQQSGTDRLEGVRGREDELPVLYVSAEKTQVRQIPLVSVPPWPFKFLLELGGCIVCTPVDRRDFALELRQYLNNHPQFEIRVQLKEWPTGEVLVFTWWLRALPKIEAKENLNVA